MKELGEIKTIVNENMVLFSSSEPLEPDEILVVYGILKERKLFETVNFDKLIFPKGEIRVICEQSEKIYLGERFKENIEKRKTIREPSNIERAFSPFQPKTKEVFEIIHGPWSAELDVDKNLGISTPKKVTIGDIVGRK